MIGSLWVQCCVMIGSLWVQCCVMIGYQFILAELCRPRVRVRTQSLKNFWCIKSVLCAHSLGNCHVYSLTEVAVMCAHSLAHIACCQCVLTHWVYCHVSSFTEVTVMCAHSLRSLPLPCVLTWQSDMWAHSPRLQLLPLRNDLKIKCTVTDATVSSWQGATAHSGTWPARMKKIKKESPHSVVAVSPLVSLHDS